MTGKNYEQVKQRLYIGMFICLVGIMVCVISLLVTDLVYANKNDSDVSIVSSDVVPVKEEAAPVSQNVYIITAEERELIARLVHCEASCGSQEMRIAVASVIFNRLDSGKWGDTIHDVIYYRNAFTPVVYDQLYRWDIDQRDYDAVDYVVANGPTVPTYVRYFRADYDHKWENYQNYCVIDDMYFGYFTDWQQGNW